MNEMDEYFFNGYRYFAKYEIGGLPQIEHYKEVPEFLYKYYSFSKYNVEALVKNCFYASHPYELNDILDSSRFLFYASGKLQFQAYENLYKNLESPTQLMEVYQEDLKNGCSNYISMLYTLISDRFGVISISENGSDELMWPHYTQEKGFQIKFKTEVLSTGIKRELPPTGILVGLYPNNYTEKIEPIDICKFNRFDVPFIYSTSVKSDKWKYEKEWRFIVSKGKMGVPFRKLGFSDLDDHEFKSDKRYISYGFEAIDAICLGFNFFTAADFYILRHGEKCFEVEPLKIKRTIPAI